MSQDVDPAVASVLVVAAQLGGGRPRAFLAGGEQLAETLIEAHDRTRHQLTRSATMALELPQFGGHQATR